MVEEEVISLDKDKELVAEEVEEEVVELQNLIKKMPMEIKFVDFSYRTNAKKETTATDHIINQFNKIIMPTKMVVVEVKFQTIKFNKFLTKMAKLFVETL